MNCAICHKNLEGIVIQCDFCEKIACHTCFSDAQFLQPAQKCCMCGTRWIGGSYKIFDTSKISISRDSQHGN